jgi:hypothetical protein
MRKTPRTDACQQLIINSDASHSSDISTALEFARMLEAELAAAREELQFISDHGGEMDDNECVRCNGSWCAAQARAFLASKKNTLVVGTTAHTGSDMAGSAYIDAAKETPTMNIYAGRDGRCISAEEKIQELTADLAESQKAFLTLREKFDDALLAFAQDLKCLAADLAATREELAQLKANTYTAVDFQGRTVEHAAKEAAP